MKKIAIFLSFILILTLTIAALTACNRTQPEPDAAEPISYMQQCFYMGKTKDFTARLTGGISEALFVADGVSQDVHAFTTLTLIPQHVDLFNESYTFTLKGDKGEYSGALDKDSFGASYSAEIPSLDAIGTPTEVTVKSDKIESTIALSDMLAESITGAKALEIAHTSVEAKLTADTKPREIYVKYINDAESDASDYYWYVAFIASPTDYYAVLISPSGELVSVNP